MAERDRRKSSAPSGGGGSSTSLNEPGPTERDATDSNAQVPAGMAELAVNQNKRAAELRLAEVRPGVSNEDVEQLRRQAEGGFGQDALGTVGSLIGWIDGPRQAINLAMQDFAGGEAGPGHRNPNVGDYWNALWGGVEDQEGFEIATGLNPMSGSDTLDMFGWDLAEEDDNFGRVIRGVADFGLQVLTDPLTYVTFGFGGIAKKAVMSGARAMQLDAITAVGKAVKRGTSDALTTSYQKLLYSQRDDLVRGFKEKILQKAKDNGGVLPDRLKTSMKRTVGSDDVTKMSDDKVLELAIADRFHDDLIRPLAGKNFKKISGDIYDELPAYMKGGARINVPFYSGFGKPGVSGLGRGKGGILIPGTTGTGKTLVGDPIRAMRDFALDHSKSAKWASQQMEGWVKHMNRSAPLMKALRAPATRGGIEGWQFHILESSKENLIRRNANHEISTDLNAMWNEISDLADESGVSLDEIGPDIWARMEGQNIDDVMLRQAQGLSTLDPTDATGLQSGLANVYKNADLDNAVHQITTYLQDIMADYHAALSNLDPAFKEKYIKGYIPHKATPEGYKWLQALADSDAFIPTGQGDAAADMASAMMASAGRSGVVDASQGATGHIGRWLGRLQAIRWSSDGFMMLDENTLRMMNTENVLGKEVATDTRFIDAPTLNEQIMPILEKAGREAGVAQPKGLKTLYNENPIEVTIGYVDSMSEAIEVWQHVDGLKRAGLAGAPSHAVDMQSTLQRMQDQVGRVMNDMATTKFGTPVPGETETMPLDWLNDITDAKSVNQSAEDIAGGAYDGIRDSIRTNGFDANEPLLVGVKPDGQLGLMNGHHRVQLLNELGHVDAPVNYIPVPMTEDFGGSRFLHDMKPGWHEEATKAYNANIKARGAALGKGVQPPRAQWVAADVMHQTSWDGRAVPDNLLAGQQAVPGVPTPVYKELKGAGFVIRDLADVEDARHLAQDIGGGEVSNLIEQTPIPRPNHFAGVDRIPHARAKGWSSEGADHFYGNGKRVLMVASVDDGVFRVSKAANLSAIEKSTVEQASIRFLDNAFSKGVLKGKFTNKGIRELIGEGLDAESGARLHEYIRRKLGTLPPESMEFIAKEPAEIYQARLLADDFRNKYRETVQAAAAVMDESGNLVRGGKDAVITPDELMRQRLIDLDKAGRMAGDAGYEEIARVMNDVTEFMEVRNVPGMIDPATVKLSGPAVDGLQIQVDMANHLALLARNHAMLSTPQGIAAAKRAGNSVVKWWKAAATIPNPAFHIRNFVGGTYQNLASGVTPMSHKLAAANTVKWRNALRAHKGPGAIEAAMKAVDPALEGTFRAAWKEGVLNGFATTEFSSALNPGKKVAMMDFFNIFDADGFALNRAGARVMEGTEDFMRMAMFIEYFDEAAPNSSMFSREMVNGTHFDYSDLTPFETRIKSIVPFYVWTRRNIPQQLRQAVENPRLIQRYGAMMRAMNDNLGGNDPLNLEEADHFTAYAAGTNYKVNPETPFWARVMIDPDLPIGDLIDLTGMGSVTDFVEERLGPHLTILQDLNAQRDFGDVNAPAPINTIFQSLAAVGFYDIKENQNVRIPYFMRTLQETALPWSRNMLSLAGGPSDPNRQQRVGIHPDDDYLERSLKSLAGTVTSGMGIKTTTPADTRQAAYRQSQEHQQRIKEMRFRGELIEDDS